MYLVRYNGLHMGSMAAKLERARRRGEKPTPDFPGMTAELTLLFSRGEEAPAYLVPVQALAPGTAESVRVSVYIFDPETSTVRRTPLEGKGMIGDQAIVTKGLAPGDIVVVAGVPFLRDGQQVKLMNPAQVAQ